MSKSAYLCFLRVFMLAVVSMSLNAGAKTLEFRCAYLGKHKEGHVVTAIGRDIQITKKGHNDRIKLSENKRAVAWIQTH